MIDYGVFCEYRCLKVFCYLRFPVRYFIKSLTDEMQAKAVDTILGHGLKYKIYLKRRLIRAYDVPARVQDKLRAVGCVVEEEIKHYPSE